jgi:hypothetical protein
MANTQNKEHIIKRLEARSISGPRLRAGRNGKRKIRETKEKERLREKKNNGKEKIIIFSL